MFIKQKKSGINKQASKFPKYRQLDISVFFVTQGKTDQKMAKATTKKKGVYKSKTTTTRKSRAIAKITKTCLLPHELLHYSPPEALVIISDEEDDEVIPQKQRKVSDVSTEDDQCSNSTEVAEKQINGSPKQNFSKLKLKKLLTIGVFPSKKLDLNLQKSSSTILQHNKLLFNKEKLVTDDTRIDKVSNMEASSSLQAEVNDTHELLSSLTVINTETQNNPDYYSTTFRHIFQFVSSHPGLSKLLTEHEKRIFYTFLNDLDDRCVVICIRLFIRIQKWTNIFKLTSLIKLEMSDAEVRKMYWYLSQHGFVDTDVSAEAPIDLLQILNVTEVREICKSFKIRCGRGKKDLLIKKLLEYCNTQQVIVAIKDTATILMERIKDKMGICVKLSTQFYNMMRKIHLLYSFTNKEIGNASDMYFFLGKVYNGDICFPSYCLDKHTTVFNTIEEFEQFAIACECRQSMEIAFEKKEKSQIMNLCEMAYEQLIEINNEYSEDYQEKPAHFKRFTAGHVYTKALSFGIEHLTKHYPAKIEEFLQFLLKKNRFCETMHGTWYNLLTMVRYNYLKKIELAGETIIQALAIKYLNEVDQCVLNHRAEYIKKNKSNRLSKLISDRIRFAQSTVTYSCVEINAQELIGLSHLKKKHYIEHVKGEAIIQTVEEKALNHYRRLGYTNGFHCEGSLIWTLFTILLWNVIYDDSVPNVFISDIQELPLDFFTKEFYKNRKDTIDHILNDIETYSEEQLSTIIQNCLAENGAKKCLIHTNLSLNYIDAANIVLCITLPKLVLIFKRILSDMYTFRSGLPDLFVWNVETRECKFVEVKSQSDKLSCKQEVWLRFLTSIGCRAEICKVNSKRGAN